MSTYADRKKARTEAFAKNVKGWKLIKCGACNGSGYYDSSRHPECGCCGGTGKERVSPEQYASYMASEQRQVEAQAAHMEEIAHDPGCLGISRASKMYRDGHRGVCTEVHPDDLAQFIQPVTSESVDEYMRYFNEEIKSREWSANYDAEHLQPARSHK